MAWIGAIAAVAGGALASKGAKDAAGESGAGSAAAVAEQRRQFDTTRRDYAPYRNIGFGALNQLAAAYGIPGYANTPLESSDSIRKRLFNSFLGTSKDGDTVDGLMLDKAVDEELARQREASFGQVQNPQGITHDVSADDVMKDPGYAFGLRQGEQAIARRASASGGRLSGAQLKAASQFGTNYASTKYGEAYQRRQDRLNRLAAIAGVGQTATAGSAAAGASSANAISGILQNQGDTNAAARLAQGNIWGGVANQFGAMAQRQYRTPSYSSTTPYDAFPSGQEW
jgi:hypothetical protein